MRELWQLQELIEFGIPITLLARECHCTPRTIQNYLQRKSVPTGTKIMNVKDGLKRLQEKINLILRA